MAMNWLKGLVAPPADFPGQGAPPGMGTAPQGMPPQAGGPPIGGSPYGVTGQEGFGGGPPPGSPIPGAPAYVAPQWSTGTRSQGQAQGAAGTSTASDARIAQLEHDLQSMALFARTLLTMLEEKNVVTRAEFEAVKNKLDMLDGKLDDR